MNTFRKIYESDEQGIVRVELPVTGPHRRVEVVVIWQEVDEARDAAESRAEKRQELETLAGPLADDPIERPDYLSGWPSRRGPGNVDEEAD